MKKEILFALCLMIFAPALQVANADDGTDVIVTDSNAATENKTGEQKNGTGDGDAATPTATATPTPPGRFKRAIDSAKDGAKKLKNRVSGGIKKVKNRVKSGVKVVEGKIADKRKGRKEVKELKKQPKEYTKSR